MPHPRSTRIVSNEVFRTVYDSPRSLPGKEKWLTSEPDVRAVEKILGLKPKTIGAPLWVSGDTKNCTHCGRETNWLDIVTSALDNIHDRQLIARIILGDKKYVNVEAPHAIAGLSCFKCKQPIADLRSFKCHNWAYAAPELVKVLEGIPMSESGNVVH